MDAKKPSRGILQLQPLAVVRRGDDVSLLRRGAREGGVVPPLRTPPRAASFFGEGSVPNGALGGPGRPENLANSLAVTLSLNCDHHYKIRLY